MSTPKKIYESPAGTEPVKAWTYVPCRSDDLPWSPLDEGTVQIAVFREDNGPDRVYLTKEQFKAIIRAWMAETGETL